MIRRELVKRRPINWADKKTAEGGRHGPARGHCRRVRRGGSTPGPLLLSRASRVRRRASSSRGTARDMTRGSGRRRWRAWRTSSVGPPHRGGTRQRSPGPRPRGGTMRRIDTRARQHTQAGRRHRRRVAGGVERPGAGGGVAPVVGPGVAADRTGPDRVGSRARRSGAAARAALARGRGPSSGGAAGGRKAWRRRAVTLARVSGIFGSHPILGNVARQDSAEREIIPRRKVQDVSNSARSRISPFLCSLRLTGSAGKDSTITIRPLPYEGQMSTATWASTISLDSAEGSAARRGRRFDAQQTPGTAASQGNDHIRRRTPEWGHCVAGAALG